MRFSKLFLCAVGIMALSITASMAKTVKYSCGSHSASLSSEDCTADIGITVSCSEAGVTTSVSGDNVVSSCSGSGCNVTSVLCDLCPPETPWKIGTDTDYICCKNSDDVNVGGSCCVKNKATSDKSLCCKDNEVPTSDNQCCSKYRAFDNNQRCCPHELTYDGACCKDTYPTPMGGKDIDENYDVRCCPSNQKKLVSNSDGSTTMCCPNDSADTLIWNNCCPTNRATKDGSKCCDMGQFAATAEGSSKCCYNTEKTRCQNLGRNWHDEDCTCECPEDRKYGTDKCCEYELESGICCERGVSGNRTGNDADGNQSQTCCESAGGSWKNSICCSKENPGKTFGGVSDSRCPICSNGKDPTYVADHVDGAGEIQCAQIDIAAKTTCCAEIKPGPGGIIKNGKCCITKACQCQHAGGEMENGHCCPK